MTFYKIQANPKDTKKWYVHTFLIRNDFALYTSAGLTIISFFITMITQEIIVIKNIIVSPSEPLPEQDMCILTITT